MTQAERIAEIKERAGPYLLALVQSQEERIAELVRERGEIEVARAGSCRRADSAESRLAGLISAAKARQAYEQRTPKYFGHDCQWCSACYDQLRDMERAAIDEATK